MAKNQNTWAKRKREMDKKRKAEEKRENRKQRRIVKKAGGGGLPADFEGVLVDEFGNVIEPEVEEVEVEAEVTEEAGEAEKKPAEDQPPANPS